MEEVAVRPRVDKLPQSAVGRAWMMDVPTRSGAALIPFFYSKVTLFQLYMVPVRSYYFY